MMSRTLLVSLCLAALAGCVWPPNSDVAPPQYQSDVSFSVHQTIAFHVGGGADTTNVVLPIGYNYYGDYGYVDSVRYIIVNGDTAFRHLTISSAPIMDSSVRYFIDGRVNYVAIVFPSSVRTDTISEMGFQGGITAPAIGDTIIRDSATAWYYKSDDFTPGGASKTLTVTDSLHPYSKSLVSDVGVVEFERGNLYQFQKGPLLVTLRISNDYDRSYYTRRSMLVDRVVPYVLK